jgi:hypothetical protein
MGKSLQLVGLSRALRRFAFAGVALVCAGTSLSCGVSAPEPSSDDDAGQLRQDAQSYADGALFRENFENNDWTISQQIINQTYTNGVDGRILRSSFPGGSANCCTGSIASASANCSSAGAPCKY